MTHMPTIVMVFFSHTPRISLQVEVAQQALVEARKEQIKAEQAQADMKANGANKQDEAVQVSKLLASARIAVRKAEANKLKGMRSVKVN